MQQIEVDLFKTNAENERVKRVAEESKNTSKRQKPKDLKEQLRAAQTENARLMAIVQSDSSAASSEEEEKEEEESFFAQCLTPYVTIPQPF